MNSSSLKHILMDDSVYFLTKILETMPNDTKIYLKDDPIYMYFTKFSPPLRCLKILMDDPRFVFDADFLANHIVWLADFQQAVLLEHPRCKKLLQKERYFMQNFDKKYPDGEFYGFSELARTYYKASRIIDNYNDKKRREKLFYFWIPFMLKWVQDFKRRYYSIGGRGYEKARVRFEYMQLKKAN